jgi:hypothetical protein
VVSIISAFRMFLSFNNSQLICSHSSGVKSSHESILEFANSIILAALIAKLQESNLSFSYLNLVPGSLYISPWSTKQALQPPPSNNRNSTA